MSKSSLIFVVLGICWMTGCATAPVPKYAMNPQMTVPAAAPAESRAQSAARRQLEAKLWTGWVLVQATLDAREAQKVVLINDFPEGDVLAKFIKPESAEKYFSWPVPGEYASLLFTRLFLKELEKSPPLLIATVNPLIERKFDCEIVTEPATAWAETTGEYKFLMFYGDVWYVYKISIDKLQLIGETQACVDLAHEIHTAKRYQPF